MEVWPSRFAVRVSVQPAGALSVELHAQLCPHTGRGRRAGGSSFSVGQLGQAREFCGQRNIDCQGPQTGSIDRLPELSRAQTRKSFLRAGHRRLGQGLPRRQASPLAEVCLQRERSRCAAVVPARGRGVAWPSEPGGVCTAPVGRLELRKLSRADGSHPAVRRARRQTEAGVERADIEGLIG